MKSEYKRYAKSGPGGRKCGCCYPQQGPFRKLMDRRAKKNWHRMLVKRIAKELE